MKQIRALAASGLLLTIALDAAAVAAATLTRPAVTCKVPRVRLNETAPSLFPDMSIAPR